MMRDLQEMQDRAQRRLDGSKVNVDAMAQDVMDLVRSVRALQAALANARRAEVHVTPPAGAAVDPEFTEMMQGIFGKGVKVHTR